MWSYATHGTAELPGEIGVACTSVVKGGDNGQSAPDPIDRDEVDLMMIVPRKHDQRGRPDGAIAVLRRNPQHGVDRASTSGSSLHQATPPSQGATLHTHVSLA